MELTNFKSVLGAAVVTVGLASTANATIVTVFDGIAAGRADFDSTVAGAGGSVQNTVMDAGTRLSNSEIDYGDFTIKNNDGSFLGTTTYGDMSGSVVDISPALNAGASQPPGDRAAPGDYDNSGITFTFDAPVNAVGFEVGDWATTAFTPFTGLYIAFDGGTPIQVAAATSSAEGLFPSQANPAVNEFEIFVAAFDDTDDFTEVSFWGDGLGEFLVAGGDVRYERISQGSLPPTNTSPVPLPAAAWMLLAGLGGLGTLRMRKKA